MGRTSSKRSKLGAALVAISILGALTAVDAFSPSPAGAEIVRLDPELRTPDHSPTEEGWADGTTTPSVGAEDRYTAFVSSAALTDYSKNNFAQIYISDRELPTFPRLVSHNVAADALGNGNSFAPRISALGTTVVYQSAADNLVVGDTNGKVDVFAFDILSGTTTLISKNGMGTSNGDSTSPVVNALGTVIAFESTASDLVGADDQDDKSDVFVSRGGVLSRVSAPVGSAVADGDSSRPQIDGGGSVVTFASTATNLVDPATTAGGLFTRDVSQPVLGPVQLLVPGEAGVDKSPRDVSDDGSTLAFRTGNPSNFDTRAFVVDMASGDVTELTHDGNAVDIAEEMRLDGVGDKLIVGNSEVQYSLLFDLSESSDERPFILGPMRADLDAAGDSLAFTSFEELDGDDDGFSADLYMSDLVTYADPIVEIVSVDSTEHQGLNAQDSIGGSVSHDGRFVSFDSEATTWDTENGPIAQGGGFNDVFVRDRLSRTTTQVSVGIGDTEPNGNSYFSAISGDGKWIAFLSSATNLVADDAPGTNVFRYSMATGAIELVSDGTSDWPTINYDGQYVAFVDDAGDVVRWDAGSGQFHRVEEGLDGPSNFTRISDDGDRIAFTARDGAGPASSAWIYDVGNSLGVGDLYEIAPALNVDDPDNGDYLTSQFVVSLSGDGSTLATRSYLLDLDLDDEGSLWNVADPAMPQLISGVDPTGGLSTDGMQVIVAADTNPWSIQIFDRVTGTTRYVSFDQNSESYPDLNGDGTVAVFTKDDDFTAVGDTNEATDVFVWSAFELPPTNPTLTLDVTADPSSMPVPGGLVTYTVTAGLTGTTGSATITKLVDSELGNLLDPGLGFGDLVFQNDCPARFTGELLTAPESVTCSFKTFVFGVQPGPISRTITVSAQVESLAEIEAAAIGDEISTPDTVVVTLTARTGGGGGTPTGGTGGITTGGTGNPTTTGGTGSPTTTGGTGSPTTTGGSTSSTSSTSTTSTTAAGGGSSTTSTTAARSVTTTTVAGTNRTIPVTGSNTGQLFFVALALLGVGLIVTGQSKQQPATARRRR